MHIDVALEPRFSWAAADPSIPTKMRALGSVFICPAYPPKDLTNWFKTYGVWSDPPDTWTSGELHEDLLVPTIQNPVEYAHLADTTSNGRLGLGAVQFHTYRTNATNEVHARHNHTADSWFLDGHAEPLNRTKLEKLHITALFGQDTVPGYYQ